jgi:hypothetical protein
MNYETWCERSKEILADAERYNAWRDKATDRLLTDYGPRIAALNKVFYMGCGFHYGLEQEFGRLIAALALPWQPCANHCKQIEDDWTNSIINKVLYRGVVRSIVRAEHSICTV